MTYLQKSDTENKSCGDTQPCGQLSRISQKGINAMLTGLSDAELVNRVRESKDHAAFETLFNAYNTQLQRHIIKRFKCSLADAEDAAQHAFIRLWRGTSLTKESVMPLLATYADNYVVDQWRRGRRFVSFTPDPHSDRLPFDPPAPIADEPDQTFAMIDKIPDALNSIEGRYAEAIKLYYFEGKSMAEAGAIEQVVESTVSRRVSMGLRKLKHVLTSPVAPPKNVYRACVTIDQKLAAASKRIERLREQGLSWRKIGRLVGISEGELHYQLVVKKKAVASVGLDGQQRREI